MGFRNGGGCDFHYSIYKMEIPFDILVEIEEDSHIYDIKVQGEKAE